MEDRPRLIERAFCLRQASIDSVHEKSVRHGHISTLHIWPARRPLAACRAALIATLLPDPGTPEERRVILDRLGGHVISVSKKTSSGEKVSEATEGGILHWGRESGPELDEFRKEIKKAYGGRAPRVLDPFAGGGSIPFEAMRLGCEATAVDINPVAWFILKCTLDYPNKLAGEKLPLPRFAVESPEFMREYNKSQGVLKGKRGKGQVVLDVDPMADLSWHVRAWGLWVLQQTRKELEKYYPVIDGKPTVAYLWARTVTCKNCRATIPLLKTRWLCKKDNKRVLLTIKPNEKKDGVVFGIQNDVPVVGDSVAARRAHDKQIGQGTMTRNGTYCPCCGKPGTVAMDLESIRQEGLKDKLGNLITSVVVDGEKGKEYRIPAKEEIIEINQIDEKIEDIYSSIPYGIPKEPLPGKEALGIRVPLYGYDQWYKLFNPRQLLALGILTHYTRKIRNTLRENGYNKDWVEAICAYLAIIFDRTSNQCSNVSRWNNRGEKIEGTFSRFALPIVWDYAEVNPIANTTGSYFNQVEWVALFLSHALHAMTDSSKVHLFSQSSTQPIAGEYDAIVTDPPYYDAIPYSDLMDYFYVWLKRTLSGISEEFDKAFQNSLSPKWNHETKDGELIDDSNRFDGDKEASKRAYEDGMYRVFQQCFNELTPEGRLVIVFAHKQPDAWEALVYGIIKAGFIVNGSWPIQTEMVTRMRARESAALSSSVWLVCKKRSITAQPGWDNIVLEEMKKNIFIRLHEYWDSGIRGPDFVWAATGPALEAYSKYPVVKKANSPGEVMTIAEFLRQVRRLVVDFVVGRVLSRDGENGGPTGLDDVTTYYLLHRHDFGLKDAPIGPCILYAVSCGLSDTSLTSDLDLLQKTGGQEEDEEDEAGEEEEAEVGKGSTVRLKQWNKRKNKSLGEDVNGHPAPMIDRIHRLMQLWRAGDPAKVDEYLEEHGLTHNATFHQILQAIIELSKSGEEERSILEALSNHLNNRGGTVKRPKTLEEYYNKT